MCNFGVIVSKFLKNIHFLSGIQSVLVLVALFGFSFNVAAQTSSSGYTGSSQNDIGDVIGPTTGGYVSGSTLPLQGTSTNSTAPSASTIVSGISRGIILPGLDGDPAQASTVAAILAAFDNLPAELQPAFLEAIMDPDLSAADIMDIIGDFNDLGAMHDLMDNMMCPGVADPSAFTAFAQSSLVSMIDVDVPDMLGGIDLGSISIGFSGLDGLLSSVMPGICPDGSDPVVLDPTAGDPTIDPILTSGGTSMPTVGSTPGSPPAPAPGTEPVAGHSDCSSNWENQLNNNLTSHLRNDTNNIHSHIRAGAAELGMDPSALAGIIWLESGGNPAASAGDTCSKCSATGLIQFINATAQELGMHGKMSRTQHMNYVKSMSFADQMTYVVKYFKQRGFKPGMSDLQAYQTVHGGSPGSNLTDAASGKSTNTTFTNYVLPKIEAYRCGRYNWNTLSWP